jgi:hypothetical protein
MPQRTVQSPKDFPRRCQETEDGSISPPLADNIQIAIIQVKVACQLI